MVILRRKSFVFLLLILLTACSGFPNRSLSKRIENVEMGLLANQSDPPWQRMNLIDRMAYYKVPGVSIAVINDFQIEWAKGYGVLEAGDAQPVTSETIFKPGSTAKPVVAMIALHYVEAGELALDTDVNDFLTSWKIPENDVTAQASVTLRRLLSHSAGMPYVPLHGYSQGQIIPNRLQILNGEAPANSEAVRVVMVPGTQYSYSNGGYILIEQLLEDAIGLPFEAIVEKTVLDPLGITSIAIKYPLANDLVPLAASGHRADGSVIPGGWYTFPEMGTGGSWWATPSAMAKIYIELMLTYRGQSEQIISRGSVVEMLTPQIEDRGLGPWIADDGGDLFHFGHPGHADGYKSFVVCYPKRGQGVVIMTNSDAGDELYKEIINSVSVEYGWVRDFTLLYVGIAILIIVGLLGFFMLRRRVGSI